MAIHENTAMMNPKHIAGTPIPVYLRQRVYAARINAAVCGWINARAGLNALTVINDPDLYYNIPANARVMLLMICAGLNTITDDVNFQLGFTDQINAAGNFFPVMPIKRYGTGAAKDGHLDYDIIFPIPIPIRYSDGARCITMRVQANDAAAEVDLAWNGWVEKEY